MNHDPPFPLDALYRYVTWWVANVRPRIERPSLAARRSETPHMIDVYVKFNPGTAATVEATLTLAGAGQPTVTLTAPLGRHKVATVEPGTAVEAVLVPVSVTGIKGNPVTISATADLPPGDLTEAAFEFLPAA